MKHIFNLVNEEAFMKMRKSKKSAWILAALLESFVWSGSAGASNLFITVPSDYATSNMAVITGSRVTDSVDSKSRVVIEGLNRDPATYGFRLNGKGMAFLRMYNYSTSDLVPSKVIPADTDWSGNYVSGTVTQGANPHSAAGYGNYIYTGDYDLGTVAVSKVDGTALLEDASKSVKLMDDINKYDNKTYGSGDYHSAQVHGEGLAVKDGNLFVVTSVNPYGGYDPYDDSYIMQYKINSDGSLTYVSHTRSVRNPDSVQLQNYNDLLMHTGIGGYQWFGYGNNETTGITIATLSGGRLSEENTKKVVMPETPTGYGYDMRDMVVHPNGTVYILAYNLSGSGGGTDMAIYKTTVTNLYSDNPVDWEVVVSQAVLPSGETASAWFNKIYAEYYTKRLWAEYGDNVVVYKDGDQTPTLSWSAQTMGDYSTFNSAMLLKTDEVTGTTALLSSSREEGLTSPSVTTTKIVNTDATAKSADYVYRITGTNADTAYADATSDYTKYTFSADKVIQLRSGKWKEADKTNNILGAIYAHDGNDITVDAAGHTLQLQVQNSVATPVGVYTGNGKNVTINADKLNIILTQASSGNSLTNAIMNDGLQSKSSAITVNGDVNINMTGAYGGNGVAVQKTDRWGEASYAADSGVSHTITINGNLKVKGADSDTWGIPLNYDNVYSRFNNAGILTQVKNSRVDVSGTANMDVYGNGITTNAAGSVVSVGGGEINVPKGMNYGYYTLAAFQGTINVNTGKNGNTAGTKAVKLGGDIFTLSTGTVNLALTTSDSYLRGIIDNGGTVNLTLQNGAEWINAKNNTRYSGDNEDVGNGGLSRVTKLVGGEKGKEGVIYQKSESGALTIGSYSGNTLVIYEHNKDKPTTIYGGDVTIETADKGSAMTLSTDNSGIDTTNTKTVATVLDALAKKLYYIDYPNGSSNLSGKVQIAEGLTASSAAKVVGTIAFNGKTGQGSLGAIGEDTPETKTETPPDGNNTESTKDFVLDADSWTGSNSGNQVSLTMTRSATWTGDNTGTGMKVSAEKSTWEGKNSGVGTTVTLDASSWNGDSAGSGLSLTATESSYEGNISGDNSTVTLSDSSSWVGQNTGKNLHITIAKGSSWTGGNTAEGVTMTMKKDALWNVQGDSILKNFETSTSGASLLMASAKTAAAGGGATIDMTDDTAGTLTIENYSGDATAVYKHDAADTTSFYGGDLTIQKAASGSKISLLTDNTGLDMTNKIAIREMLDALAKKLYYKEATSGITNLTGTVKIAEGLTSASAAKFTGGISYDAKTGQGSLDTTKVDYGSDFPTTQNDTSTFTTGITGDYVKDKVFRDAGVLPNEDNVYTFNKKSTVRGTATTDGEAVKVSKDTTIDAGGNTLTLSSMKADSLLVTGGTLTVKNAKTSTVTASTSSKAAINAEGGNVVLDVSSVSISGAIKASKGGIVTAKNVYSLSKDITTEDTATVDITFLSGKTWSGSNKGTTKLTMDKGTWKGTNSGKLTGIFTNGSKWTGANSGAGSSISMTGSTWSGANSGDDTEVSLNASTWSAANTAKNLNLTMTEKSSWTKGNTGDGATVTADASIWTGDNGGANAKVTLKNESKWTGSNTGAGLVLSLDKSSWEGNTSAAGSAILANGSTWTGASTSDAFTLDLNNSTWVNTGASSFAKYKGTAGVIDMTNANSGDVNIAEYEGSSTVIYAHNATDPTSVSGGNFTVAKAASGSTITLLTDNTGVDTTEEDSIYNALNALANKLYYTGYITKENNLTGTVKIAEGLTAASAAKQTANVSYDSTTGQASAVKSSITPGPFYPTEQDTDAFTTQITGVHETDKEYRKHGVLSNTVDNNIYNFTMDASTVTTSADSIITAKDTQINFAGKELSVKSTAGDAIATTGGKLTLAGATLNLNGANAVNAANSEVVIDATEANLTGNISATGSGSVTAKNVKKLIGNISAADTANIDISFAASGFWTGNNTGHLKLNLTDGFTWKGNHSGTNLVLSLDKSTWEGDTSAAGSATLTNGSTWTGASTSDAFTMSLNNSTWVNTGASTFAKYKGTNGVIDMTNAKSGNVTIAEYSGSSTVIYKHDETDPTSVSGGKFTVTKAITGSTVTLMTDNKGVDMTDEDSIYNALNALANKLYYTNSYKGETNLAGTVKIAEGLTAASATKQTASVSYSGEQGQASVQKETITPGPSYPTEQDTTAFTTQITGVHETDIAYRKHGVLSNTSDTHTYNFIKDETTITTDAASAIATSTDTTINTSGNLVLTSTNKNAIEVTGGKLTVAGNGTLTSTGKTYSVYAKDAEVVLDVAKSDLSKTIYAEGSAAKVTVKNLETASKTYAGNIFGKNNATFDVTFADGMKWTGTNKGKSVITMKNGTWTAANESTGTGSVFNLENTTWSGKNSGSDTTVNLTNGASWTNTNSAANATINLKGSTWTKANTGSAAKITLSEDSTWEGANSGANAEISLDRSTWTGNTSASGSAVLTNGSTWTGTSTSSGFALTLNQSTWENTGTASLSALSGTSGIIDMTGENAGNITIGNYSGNSTFYYAHDESDPTNVYGGNVTIKSAAQGSSVTLVTDGSGIDQSDEDSLFGALDALAKKLYYTGYASNERNLTGTVQIGEGLTRAAASMQTAAILFDDATGQGGLDKVSVTPGPDYPTEQSQENYTTSITGSYQADNDYRKTGVIVANDTTNTYNFTKDATTVTTDGSSIATSTDTTIDVHDHNLTVTSTDGNAVDVTGGKLTVKNGGNISLSGEYAVNAKDGNVDISGKSVTLSGDVAADNAAITVKEIKSLSGDVTTEVGGTTDLTFAQGGSWKGNAAGDVTMKMTGGTWEGNSTGTLTATLSDGSSWTGDSKGVASAITLEKSKWSGNSTGTAAEITLSDESEWKGANEGNNAKITVSDSKWTGDNAGALAAIALSNASEWSGNNRAGEADISLDASKWTGDNEEKATISLKNNSTWTGINTADDTALSLNDSTWKNTGESKMATLTADGGTLDETGENAGNVTIGTLSGDLAVNITHTATRADDGSLENISFSGGNISVENAKAGSSVTLVTDRTEILSDSERGNMETLFRLLANKLTYSGVSDAPDNLTGKLEIAEGLTSPRAYGTIAFGENGLGGYKEGSLVRTDPEIVYGDSETAMMRGAKSAMAATALMWRAEANDLMKRMGDLRLADGMNGTWAKYYGGKYSYDSQKTDISVSYNAFQVGYDHAAGKNWKVGIAFSHNTGSESLGRGSGDVKSTGVGIYGTRQNEDGSYLDLIVKAARLSNEYTVYNDMGHRLDGDYSTWGLSFSAEYGKQFRKENGLTIDPSVELTIGRVNGKSYDAESDFLDSVGQNKYMHVEQEGFTSAIGRIGIGVGKENRKSRIYTKLAVAHEFGGDFKSTFSAEGEPTSSTKLGLSGTWLEWQIGGTAKLSEKAYFYGTFEKIFGGKSNGSDWRLDAGFRLSF